MEFFDALKVRRSIRAYSSQPVEADKLQRILEAVNCAPSAGNLQAYEVYLVCDADSRQALARAARDQDFLIQAPVTLVFCAHPARCAHKYEERGTELYCVQDATIACTYAMLAASALGLSTVWVGSFNEDDVRAVLGAPQAYRPVAILPIGYPAESPQVTPRRDLADLTHQVH